MGSPKLDLEHLQPGGEMTRSAKLNPHIGLIQQIQSLTSEDLKAAPFFESHADAGPLAKTQLQENQIALEDLYKNERYRKAFAIMAIHQREIQLRDLENTTTRQRERIDLDVGFKDGELRGSHPFPIDVADLTVPHLEIQELAIYHADPITPLYLGWNPQHARENKTEYEIIIKKDIEALKAFIVAKEDRMTFIEAVLKWIADELAGIPHEVATRRPTAEFIPELPPSVRVIPPPIPDDETVSEIITETTRIIQASSTLK